MQLVEEGDAIEGDSVTGQSRKPLKYMGAQLDASERKYYRYVADFDVRAKVTSGEPPNEFFANASNSREDEIICERALVHSRAGPGRGAVTRGSSTHQTNTWTFSSRTGVRVTRSHEEIKNAIRRRDLAQSPAT